MDTHANASSKSSDFYTPTIHHSVAGISESHLIGHTSSHVSNTHRKWQLLYSPGIWILVATNHLLTIYSIVSSLLHKHIPLCPLHTTYTKSLHMCHKKQDPRQHGHTQHTKITGSFLLLLPVMRRCLGICVWLRWHWLLSSGGWRCWLFLLFGGWTAVFLSFSSLVGSILR